MHEIGNTLPSLLSAAARVLDQAGELPPVTVT